MIGLLLAAVSLALSKWLQTPSPNSKKKKSREEEVDKQLKEIDKQFKEVWATISDLKSERAVLPKDFVYFKNIDYGTFFSIRGKPDNDIFREVQQGFWQNGHDWTRPHDVELLGQKNIVCLKTGAIVRISPNTLVKIEHKT